MPGLSTLVFGIVKSVYEQGFQLNLITTINKDTPMHTHFAIAQKRHFGVLI
jgi:hypothetical protein